MGARAARNGAGRAGGAGLNQPGAEWAVRLLTVSLRVWLRSDYASFLVSLLNVRQGPISYRSLVRQRGSLRRAGVMVLIRVL